MMYRNPEYYKRMDMQYIYTLRTNPRGEYTTDSKNATRQFAYALKKFYFDDLEKKFTHHYLSGLRHDSVNNFIVSHKKKYPYFFYIHLGDVCAYIVHECLASGMRWGHRILKQNNCRIDIVNAIFVKPILHWCKNPDGSTQSIPPDSALSPIVSCLGLLGFWLTIKNQVRTPMLVGWNEVLIAFDNQHDMYRIDSLLPSRLKKLFGPAYESHLIDFGEFKSKNFSCFGWDYRGGYLTINTSELQLFKDSIARRINELPSKSQVALIKNINRQIIIFANRYKSGNVLTQFRQLDIYLRKLVRQLVLGKPHCTAIQMQVLGLQSMVAIYLRHCRKFGRATNYPCTYQAPVTVKAQRLISGTTAEQLAASIDTFTEKGRQWTRVLNKQTESWKLINDYLNDKLCIKNTNIKQCHAIKFPPIQETYF